MQNSRHTATRYDGGFSKCYLAWRVLKRGYDFLYQVLGLYAEARGVDAWVKADVFAVENIGVDQKLDARVGVIHKSHYAE